MAGRRRRKLLKIGLISLVALVLLAAAAPWFANIGPVRRLAEHEIERILGHTASVREVAASWGGGVHARGVRVTNPDPSFSDPTILEIEEVHLDMALPDIIWGGAKKTEVVIEGMRIRVEEQGGGRINLPGLVTRLFPRRDPRPRPPGAPPPAPTHLKLRGCTIEVRHMAPARGGPVVDPYAADPVIRAADDGAVTVVLESFDLDVSLTSKGATLTYRGGLLVDGKGGALAADLAPGRAEVTAKAFDIAGVGRLAGRDVGGRLEMRLVDERDTLTVAGSIAELRSADPALDEERVVIHAKLAGGRFEDLAVSNDVGDVRLRASGAPEDFKLDLDAPRAKVARALGGRETPGRLRVRVTGGLAGGVLHAKGTVASHEGPRGDATATLDADFGIESKLLTLRDLLVESKGTRVQAKGTVMLAGATECDLAGSADADLALLHDVFGPYVFDEGAGPTALEGRAKFRSARVVLGRGAMDVKATGTIDGFRVVVGDDEIAEDVALVDVDVTLRDDGNVLEVRRGSALGCELEGRIAGLKKRRPDEAWVKGTIHLTPMLARLLERDGMELDGRLDIDLSTRENEFGLTARGSVVAHDLKINDFTRKRLVLNIEKGGHTGHHWHGDATLKGRNLHARVRLMRFDPQERELRGEVSLEEAAWIADLARLLDVPPDLQLGGSIKPVVGVTWDGKTWRGNVVLSETILTLRRGQLGIREEPVRFFGKVQKGPAGLRLYDSELNIGDIKVVPSCTRADDGAWSADLVLKAMAQPLRRCIPDLEEVELSGRVVVDAKLRDGRVYGTLTGTGIAMTIDEERIDVGPVTVDADESGRFLLKSGGASLAGTARFGKTLELDLDGGGRMPALAAWFPDGFTLKDLRCRIPFGGAGGAAWVRGRFASPHLRIGGTRLFDVELEPDLRAAAGTDLLHTLRGSLTARVERAGLGRAGLTGVMIEIRDRPSKTKLRGFKYAARFEARELRSGDGQTTIRRLKMPDVTGLLAGLDFGPTSFAALGPLTFAEADTTIGRLREGSARLAWWKRRLDVLAFDAIGERGGRIRVKAAPEEARTNPVNWLDLSRPVPAYRFDVAIQGIPINKNMGKALNLTIPLLVTARDRDRKVRGTLDLEANGRGRGFDLATIEDTLFAAALVTMHDAEFEGSAALSLSGLEIGAAFDGRNYRFKKIEVSPTYRDGVLRITPRQTLIGGRYQIGLEGEATLRGRLNYKVYASYFRLPITVKGTVDNPDVRVLGLIR